MQCDCCPVTIKLSPSFTLLLCFLPLQSQGILFFVFFSTNLGAQNLSDPRIDKINLLPDNCLCWSIPLHLDSNFFHSHAAFLPILHPETHSWSSIFLDWYCLLKSRIGSPSLHSAQTFPYHLFAFPSLEAQRPLPLAWKGRWKSQLWSTWHIPLCCSRLLLLSCSCTQGLPQINTKPIAFDAQIHIYRAPSLLF